MTTNEQTSLESNSSNPHRKERMIENIFDD